ncbi:HDOD domain-containing protein [Haematospirillum jordaniae]|uniref:HDOD domain-containing protein n=1 Tax=Haematospirillum jordaniae TaxID=1549855 RepID=UPI001432EA0E|nr:HDOD domain-containing protein [Haematospirillum jordaniae]NKD86298.1 HDOD domain-containing protein [Haematospirillum jordaniae]
MSRILFVDDDPRLLQGLKRLTISRGSTWHCDFALSGAEGLSFLRQGAYDIVISDMQMPRMNGAEFLEQVRILSPQAVRIVLSGYSHIESIVSVAGSAHQYVAKPCSFEQLMGVIVRALALRQSFSRTALHSIVGKLHALPSPSERYTRLLALLESPLTSTDALATVMKDDIAMVAEVLKLTNSQYFALTNTATSIEQAIRLLGTDIIRMLVFNVGIFSSFKITGPAAILMGALQARAMRLSTECAGRAADAGLPSTTVQMARIAGMLCEIGVLVLLNDVPQSYTKLACDTADTGLRLLEAEQESMGINHAELGAYLLGLWGFQDDIVWALTALSPCAPAGHDPGPIAPILQNLLAEDPLEYTTQSLAAPA